MGTNNKTLILIVDDTPRNLQLLAEILYDAGYEVAIAQNGKIALELLTEIQPELILLDIMMPDMDGFTACKIIKSNPKHKDIPIIFLSAKTDADSIVNGFQIGAADYVTKPFNSVELLARVKTHLSLRTKELELKELNQHLEERIIERTEELNTANTKLEKLDVSKSYFIGLLAHELNTPITGIQTSSLLILESTSQESVKELAQITYDSAQRLKKLASATSLISQLQLNKYPVMIEDTNAQMYLKAILFEISASHKETEIIVNISNDNTIIKIDAFLIQTVLSSILENSVKYQDENRPQESITIKSYISGSSYFIAFIDKGKGFSKLALEHLFSLFSSDELMHHKEGYGLSLSAAKVIMDYHNGNIVVRNNESFGATVTLEFKIEG